MPEEILVHIFSFCDWRSLANMQCTSTLMCRVAGDTEERACRRVDVMKATSERNVGALYVYLKYSDKNANYVAVKCVLRFITRQDTPSILERQLLCFLHHREITAGQIIMMVPNGVRLGHNPSSVWLEWCVACALWRMSRIPTAIREWVAGLRLPLLRPDKVFCDHLFYNWPGNHDQMKTLLSLVTANGTTFLNLLMSRIDVCFTTTILASQELHFSTLWDEES